MRLGKVAINLTNGIERALSKGSRPGHRIEAQFSFASVTCHLDEVSLQNAHTLIREDISRVL